MCWVGCCCCWRGSLGRRFLRGRFVLLGGRIVWCLRRWIYIRRHLTSRLHLSTQAQKNGELRGGGGRVPPLSWMWVRICPPILFTISATFSIAAWVRGGTLDGKGSISCWTLTVCLREFTPFVDVEGGSLRASSDRESIDDGR